MRSKKSKLLYEETGGIKFGDSYLVAANYSWPHAKIHIFKNKLIIVFKVKLWNPDKLIFKKEDIEYIEKYRGFFSRGIKINHNKLRTFPFIVFWSYSTDKLINKLKIAGYKIK